MKRKGQAAMEYLMTYGWAILIVIIVAAALFALGVFNPGAWTGSTSTGFGGLGVPSYWDMTSNGDFNVVLQNTQAGELVTVYNITATLAGTDFIWTTYDYDDAGNHLALGTGSSIDLKNYRSGTNNPYDINFGTQTAGSSYSVEISMNVKIGSSPYETTIVGTLTGAVSS